jgi:hypothetical protein
MPAQDNQRIGRLLVSTVGGETVRAYVPPALPPIPPVRLDSVQRLLEQANQALGRLDGLASFLPDLSLFIYAYVRKEALLSGHLKQKMSISPFVQQLPDCGRFTGSPHNTNGREANPKFWFAS